MNDYGVYIPGAATPDERSSAALARAAEISLTDARMLLTSPLPKKVKAESTSDAAAARVRRLKEAGLDAFAVTGAALRRTRPPRLKSFRKEGGRILFEPGGLAFEPRLIVHGEIRAAVRIDTIVNVEDDGPPRLERERGPKHSSFERFLRLYGASHAEAVEIRPAAFNFRGLGKDFGPTLAANVARFLALFPAARVDDTLLRCPPVGDEQGGGINPVHRESNEEAALRTSTLIALDVLRC